MVSMTTSKSPLRHLDNKLTSIHRSKWADNWFQTLESVVHPIINEKRKDNQKQVRIAILDTGVDITHPQIQAARDANRIVAYFPESTDRTPDSFQDKHGHGTHGTSLLLRTAPNAAIYIAKVTDEDEKLRYDDIVKVHLFIPGSLNNSCGLGNKVGDSKASSYHFDFLGNNGRYPFYFNGSESGT
jgi:subtilisin family serine protease